MTALVIAGLAVAGCGRPSDVPATDSTAVLEESPASAPSAVTPSGAAGAQPAGSLEPSERSGAARVVVSYFHRTIRCETCLKFEALTQRALEDAFADELASGVLSWQVMDFEAPGHETQVETYGIFESSVIVSRFSDGVEVEWKKLDAIWSLAGDDGAFIQYIQSEVGLYLGGDAHGG